MAKHRPTHAVQNVDSGPLPRSLTAVALAASALLAGCGPADTGTITDAEGEPIAESQAPLLVDCSTITPDNSWAEVKGLAKVLAAVVKAYKNKDAEGAIGVAEAIMGFGDVSVDARIEALNAQLFCLAQALDWKMVQLDYNTNQFAPVSAAWMEARSVGFERGSFYDASSHSATVAAGGRVMFTRLYSPGDPATNGPWKSIISDNQPAHPNNQVFDVRMALPGFMRLLAARIAMIAMMDPNFASSGLWNPELGDGTPAFPGYRGVLKERLQEMIAGVRCGFRDRLKPGISGTASYDGVTDVACADVNTGLSATTTYTRPECQNLLSCGGPGAQHVASYLAGLPSTTTGIAPLQDQLRRQVLKQMPIFEVQSVIDTLYHYTHPAADLAEASGRIPLTDNQGLCLDVPGGNPAPGTPLQIFGCHGGAPQQFAYDRENHTIRNTALDKCVQVRPFTFNFPWPIGTLIIDNLAAGAIAEIADCTNPPADRQKWTYDPEEGIIRGALGTVLDVQWGNLQSGTPVWLWDYNASGAQRWHADAINLALGRPSWQSSDLPGYGAVAARANDGNTDGNFWNGSVTHTDWGYSGWGGANGPAWYVDLGSERTVNAVRIFNRTDCCTERLSHYNIMAFDSNDYTWKVVSDHAADDTSGAAVLHWPINPVRTQFVMIAKTDENYLSLAEVQVMGF